MWQPEIPPNLSPLIEAYGITFANTLGALLIGFTLSIFLFGLLTFQVYHYYIHHPDARFVVKFLVALVWLFDLGQSIFQMHGLFYVLAINYGNVALAVNFTWTINSSVIWSAWVYAMVQGFLTYRIKVLSGSYAIPILCCLAIVVRFAFTIASAVVSLTLGLFDFEETRIYLAHGALITGIILDNLVAGSLSYYLFNRGREVTKRTQNTIRDLIVFSVETGIVTTIIGMITTITCWTMPHNAIWIAVLFFHSKIYANSLMLSLNREIPQEKLHVEPISDLKTSLKSRRSARQVQSSSKAAPQRKDDVVIELSESSWGHSKPESAEIAELRLASTESMDIMHTPGRGIQGSTAPPFDRVDGERDSHYRLNHPYSYPSTRV